MNEKHLTAVARREVRVNDDDWSRARQHFWLCLFSLYCDFNSVIYYIQSTIFEPGLLSTIPLIWLREPTDWLGSATRYSRTGESRLRCQVLCGSALFFLLWPTCKWLLYPNCCLENHFQKQETGHVGWHGERGANSELQRYPCLPSQEACNAPRFFVPL